MSYERSPTDKRERAPKLSRVTVSRLPSALRRDRDHDERPMTDVIAVDVGGTKLAAGIVRRRRHARSPGRHADPARRRRRRALRDARRSRRPARRSRRGRGGRRVRRTDGRAAASTCRRSTSPRGAPSRCARGSPRTPALPVWVDNDAKALALGEGWIGAARRRGATTSAMVVSTGVGGGIVLDGRLLDGADGNAGHIGHVIVEPDGPRVRVRRARLPRGRGVGHRRSPASPARPPARRAARGARAHRHARRAARSHRSPTCSTCRSRSSAARSRSASASRSSPPRSASSTRAAGSTSRAARASSPGASAPTAPSSAPRASPSPGCKSEPA